MRVILHYANSLRNPEFVPTGLKTALVVGSILFAINHGMALLHDTMNRHRWVSAALTYLVPYMVSIHGQQSASDRRPRSPSNAEV